MATSQQYGFNELFAHLIGEIAKSVCERSGETAQQQFARSQAAVHMIMGFLPRDVTEALLAGHSLVLHEMMLASVHDTLHGEADATRHATRSGLIAMNKEFNNNLALLARYQARPAAGRRDIAEPRPDGVITAKTGATLTPAAATLKPAVPQAPTPSQHTPAQSTQADTAGSVAQKELDWLAEHDPEARMQYHPSPAVLAACQANPEAMAAMAAGDPERWAKAMGIAIPDEAFLAAANTPGSPFDPNATGPWPASTASKRTG
jgi:hypothetical protein